MAVTKVTATIRMTIGEPEKDGKNFNYCILSAEVEAQEGKPQTGAELFEEAVKECKNAYITHFHKGKRNA